MNRMFATFAALACTAMLTIASATEPATEEKTPLPKDLTELTVALNKILVDSKTPGMALAIATRDEVLFAGGLGYANVASKTPADADTMFRIGSTSKAFVAMAALKLAREGRLDLNAPLRTLAPEIAFSNPWEATDPVRFVHLLEHTTGFDDIHLRDYAHEDPTPNNLEAALAWDPDSRVSRWRPGTRMAYCNSGPAVAAFVIQKITGEPIEDYVAREIFQPIGMARTNYLLSDEVKRTQATLYHSDGVTPYPYWHIAMRPAGSINSSARDMAEYVRLHLNRGKVGPAGNQTELLSETDFIRMETAVTNLGAAEGLKVGYGLHNYTAFDEDGFLWRGHNGGVLGGASDFSYLPEHGIGYSILVNGTTETGFPELTKLVRRYLTQQLTKPKDLKLTEGSIPAEIVEKYDGYYLPVNPRVELFAPLERIFGVSRLGSENGAMRYGDFLSADKKRLVAMTDSPYLLRREDRAVPSVVLLQTDELGAPGMVVNTTTFVKAPLLIALGPMFLFALAGLMMLAQLFFVPVWGIRRLLKRITLHPHLEVRLWPLASTLAVLGFLIGAGMMLADENIFDHFASVTWQSTSLATLSVLMPVVSGWGLYRTLRAEHRSAHRGLRGFAVLTLLANTLLAVYLLYLGWVPFVTWG